MTIGSRILRGILAASTLHLMLAVPVRACASETGSTIVASSRAAHEMSMPMAHAGHDLAAMPTPAPEHAPDADAPGRQHMPCCPTSTSACQVGTCASSVAAVVMFANGAAPSAPLLAPPSRIITHWVSYSHAPEPPPPRA
jgi:hypothetical protein